MPLTLWWIVYQTHVTSPLKIRFVQQNKSVLALFELDIKGTVHLKMK